MLVTFQERESVNFETALLQWLDYVETFRRHGWKIVEVEPADDCPDAVFIEDCVVFFGSTAVITRPGAVSRRLEIPAVERLVRTLGCSVTCIHGPGTLDGGDVLKVGKTVYVGSGSRSNSEGISQLRAVIEPLGFALTVVPTSKVLHLKSAATALPDGQIIAHLPSLDDDHPFRDVLPAPGHEINGAHVVLLGPNKVLMAGGCPLTRAALLERGLEVVEVDISEFIKLEGCVTCLSVRVRPT